MYFGVQHLLPLLVTACNSPLSSSLILTEYPSVTSLDLLKSSLVILAYGYFLDPIWQSVASAGILLGHSWSAFAGLKGGRGVVPAVGIAIVVSPLSAIVGVSIGIIIIAITQQKNKKKILALLVKLVPLAPLLVL